MPIGLAVAYIAHTRLREVEEFSGNEPFDLRGMLLFTVAFVTLTVYLSVGLLFGLLSVPMLAVLVIGIISLAAFIWHELTTLHPLIDLSLFKIRIFAYGQASSFLNSIARGAVMILLILFFQGLRGYDPLMASILIAPLAVGLIIAGPLGGILSDKYGSRSISTGGLIISFVGLAGLALMQYDTPYWVLAVWMFVNGFGSGLFQPPNTSAIMGAVPFKRRGVASSMRAFLANTGMVISMAIVLPLLIATIPLDTMMTMFVVGGMNMPMATQITFTSGIAFVFLILSAAHDIRQLLFQHCGGAKMWGGIRNRQRKSDSLIGKKLKIIAMNTFIAGICGYEEMTGTTWYIYNEFVKKERELLEKARKKLRERQDRIRNIGKDPDSPDTDK